MEQQGQPFDFLLYATITSGTTHANKDYQRDYLLTLEMINVHTGEYDKQAARSQQGLSPLARRQLVVSASAGQELAPSLEHGHASFTCLLRRWAGHGLPCCCWPPAAPPTPTG